MRYLILALSILFFANCIAQKEEPVVNFPDVDAEFVSGPNGMSSHLSANIEYPVSAIMNGESGKVFIQFIVEVDGTISNVEVLKSSGSEALDNEAVRVVNNFPKWKPATKEGEAVRSVCRIPINFEIADSSSGSEKKMK